jgi:hypothetical protein
MSDLSATEAQFWVVFCGYHEADIERSAAFLMSFRRFLPKLRIIASITNASVNLDIKNYEGLFDEITRAENDLMEFSAYQRGLDHLVATGLSPGFRGVFLINDTIWKKSSEPSLNAEYAQFALSSSFSNDAVLFGKCDSYSVERFRVGELYLCQWISTHLCFLSAPLLEKIGFKIAYNFIGEVDNRPLSPSGTLEEMFFEGIDTFLADKLRVWLFGSTWHNSKPLVDENYMFFRKKLNSILNELHLSALAQKHGSYFCTNREAQMS